MNPFISSNLTAGTSPIFGTSYLLPPTPIELPTAETADDVVLAIGIGTRYQLPSDDERQVINKSWNWLGAKAGIGFDITPTVTFTGGDVLAESGISASIIFDITPPMPAVGKDYTNGQKTPVGTTYDLFLEKGTTYKLATYTDLEATNGIDSFYCSPVITATVGVWSIFTNGFNDDGEPNASEGLILFWNESVEFTLAWRYFHSGPGIPDAMPPTPPIPLEPCSDPPPTESGFQIMLPYTATSIFDVDADYVEELDYIVSDALDSSYAPLKNPKVRLYKNIATGGDGSPVTISGDQVTIQITSYSNHRRSE